MCAVPNMAVFCSSLFSCSPVMSFMYFPCVFEMVLVASFIAGITFVFTFHVRCGFKGGVLQGVLNCIQ